MTQKLPGRPAASRRAGDEADDQPAAISPDDLRAEIGIWADRIGVRPESIQVRPMTRKWASCSSKGRLTFDAALLSEPPEFRREVIVRELLQLFDPTPQRAWCHRAAQARRPDRETL